MRTSPGGFTTSVALSLALRSRTKYTPGASTALPSVSLSMYQVGLATPAAVNTVGLAGFELVETS